MKYKDIEGLDAGIREIVKTLIEEYHIETYESCEGGEGHAFYEPTVRFHGQRDEGFRALAAAQERGYEVSSLCRVWDVIDGEPRGPTWEMTFVIDDEEGNTTDALYDSDVIHKEKENEKVKEANTTYPPLQYDRASKFTYIRKGYLEAANHEDTIHSMVGTSIVHQDFAAERRSHMQA